MWSRIDPLIQTIARKVEQTDPRMEIRRDESELYTKRKREDDGSSRSMPWEDTTIVSVTALKNFLMGLLGTVGIQSNPEHAEEDQPQEEAGITDHHDPASTYLSRATNAYQATGRAVHDKNIETPPPNTKLEDGREASMVALGEDFGEEGRAQIAQYIQDLSGLEKNGVEDIALRRTLTFLEAIGQGIIDARTNLNL